ncbi:MAG: glycosyltransferase family 39 protein [Pedobacter sp.]|nr:MAG: glycosyltransferase family 39 protein [Pedobacter sp.]
MLLSFPRKLWLFIIGFALIKIGIASILGLGNDEVYYWTYALKLEWNYFDHPPMVAWLIRATTLDLLIHNELAVRIGAIIASSICSLLIFRIGLFLANDRVAWYSVILYSFSFYCSIIAGTFILPDSPQMVFWIWAIYLFLKITRASNKGRETTYLWIWFGIACGLCMLCKVHGLYLWISAILFIVFKQPKLLAQKGLYFAAFISLVLFSPVIIWNIEHNFITYSYHSGRVSILQAKFNYLSFIRELGGALFYNNPVIVVLTWFAVCSRFRKKTFLQRREIQVLLFFGLPLIFTLLALSTVRDTLPHWSGPGYACLILLAAVKLEQLKNVIAKRWISAAVVFFLLVVISTLIIINFYPGSLSKEKTELSLGKGDPTLDLYGWPKTAEIVDSICNRNPQLKIMVVDKWFPAAHLDFYVAERTSLTTYGVGETFNIHQYALTNENKRKLVADEDALYITTSNLFDEKAFEKLKTYFKSTAPPIIIPILRNGKACKNILVFKLRSFKG